MEAVARAHPSQVYAFGDGPKPGEETACRIAGETIRVKLGKVADLRISQAPANLGLRRRVETALDEVFRQEESAVILEDDCVPADDFFPFMSQMLERWKIIPKLEQSQAQVFMIEGIPTQDRIIISRTTRTAGGGEPGGGHGSITIMQAFCGRPICKSSAFR